MPSSLSKPELHARVLTALGIDSAGHDVEAIPLLVDLPGLMPLAIWAFTLTDPKGGRHPSEAKVQLMLPGQGRGERRKFESDPHRYRILLGAPRSGGLFVLWDAYKQESFTWSKNVQVRGEILWHAEVDGLASGTRNRGTETVIACRPERLLDALRQRIASE